MEDAHGRCTPQEERLAHGKILKAGDAGSWKEAHCTEAGSWKEAHRRRAGSWKEEHLRNGWLMARGTPQERLALGRGTLHERQALRKETYDFKTQARKWRGWLLRRELLVLERGTPQEWPAHGKRHTAGKAGFWKRYTAQEASS
jgi:hypothetical protein